MNDLQKIFDDCRMFYKKCYNNVKAMAEDIARVSKDINPDITVLKFDIILQYSLLQIAAADYELDENELIFIRDLTEKGDYVSYINKIANSNITWDDIFNSNVIKFKNFLEDSYPLMDELSAEFVIVFATCDKLTDYNYFKDLENYIKMIIAGLSLMDGEITTSEKNKSCLILNAIKEIKDYKK